MRIGFSFFFIIPFFHYLKAQELPLSKARKLLFDGQEETLNFSIMGIENDSNFYFVRGKKPSSKKEKIDQNIFVGNIDFDGSTIENIRECASLNTILHDGLVGISHDLKRIYLLNSYSSEKGLSRRAMNNGYFDEPIFIDIPNLKIKTLNYGFFVHPDEKTIVISYEGENSLGSEDLYISNFVHGNWTEPIHMGNEINSKGFEISPFLSKNKDTLFFSSNGIQNSFGGADIYYSVQSQNGEWSKPVNMGPEINSSAFDAYLIQYGKYYLWTSAKEKNKADLYFTAIQAPIKLSVNFDKKNVSKYNGKDGSIQLKSISGYPPYSFKWSNGVMNQDNYQLTVGEYRVEIQDNIGQKYDTVITISQPVYEEKSILKFPQIQYKVDSWELLNNEKIRSYDSLDLIVQLLNEFPQMVIQLHSHTDCRGEEKRNLVLSQNRSRACYKYLVEQKGIDPRRIIPIGFGESIPVIYKEKSTEINVALTETYINQFKTDTKKMEYLHQLNRRTEGIVYRMNFSTSDPKPDIDYTEFLKLP